MSKCALASFQNATDDLKGQNLVKIMIQGICMPTDDCADGEIRLLRRSYVNEAVELFVTWSTTVLSHYSSL